MSKKGSEILEEDFKGFFDEKKSFFDLLCRRECAVDTCRWTPGEKSTYKSGFRMAYYLIMDLIRDMESSHSHREYILRSAAIKDIERYRNAYKENRKHLKEDLDKIFGVVGGTYDKKALENIKSEVKWW